MGKQNYSIVITGEWPGAGQSTTARLIADKLGFTRVYAGFLFRLFGYIWDKEKDNLDWKQFESSIVEGTIDLDSYQFSEADFNEQLNNQFQHQLRSVGTPEIWDKIIDQKSLEALKKPGVVVEGKVGVLLEKTGLVPDFKPEHKIIKILLTCPPEISAHRVIKRKIENGELGDMDQKGDQYNELVRETAQDIISRHLRDWERYEKIYGIYRSDIYKPGITEVDSSNKTQDQVVDTILKTIAKHTS